MTQAIAITASCIATCLGRGRAVHAKAMRYGTSGLMPCDYPNVPFECYIGRVAGIESDPFPQALAAFDSRANRISMAALGTDGFLEAIDAARRRWGADRMGAVLGTSTSGVETLELEYRAREQNGPLSDAYSLRHQNDHHAVTTFVQEYLGLTGPALTISTACSSSAKALIDAVQLIQAGFCDAVLAGGVDSLCLTSLHGFEALQLVSRQPAQPCDTARTGLSIGEGAAFVLIQRSAEGVRVHGGESSDAINMSTPPEDGAGAARAMQLAMQRAGIEPDQIGYVNLHGTATPTNDAAECVAVSNTLGNDVPVSSLKGSVGHTLGAAGAVETVMSLIALQEGIAPGNVGLQDKDPAIACNVLTQAEPIQHAHVMSNAFGFGGNNCALVLSQ